MGNKTSFIQKHKRKLIIGGLIAGLSLSHVLFINMASPIISVDILPSSVPEYTTNKEECFTADEKKQLDNPKFPLLNTTSCEDSFIAPVKTAKIERFYAFVDGVKKISCKKMRSYRLSGLQSEKAFKDLIAYANKYSADLLSNNRDSQAICLANIFSNYAKADAFVEFESEEGQSELNRMWYISGMASLLVKYPKILSMAQTMSYDDGTKADLIKKWLSDRGNQILSEVRAQENLASRGVVKPEEDPFAYVRLDKVNTQFWRGYSLLPVGLVVGRSDLIQKSREVFNVAVDQISENGYLPYELLRGSFALKYHGFAIEPILGMTVMSQATGCGFMNDDSKAKISKLLLRYAAAQQGQVNPSKPTHARALELFSKKSYDSYLKQCELKNEALKNVNKSISSCSNDISLYIQEAAPRVEAYLDILEANNQHDLASKVRNEVAISEKVINSFNYLGGKPSLIPSSQSCF